MGQAIDAIPESSFGCSICRKGPAMHSPRAQADKKCLSATAIKAVC